MPVGELRPPVAMLTDLRGFTSWCKKALAGAAATDEELNAAVAALTAAFTAADSAHVAAGDPHTQYTTAAELAAAFVAHLAAANTHASVQATLFSVGSATPVGTQAANADTSGASLAALETEVNQLKAVLRTFGMIAP